MKELISIIIPTYNRGHIILETLNSILNQSNSNWECIIIDDGSTDNTEEILNEFIKKDARFQYYKRPVERRKGPSSCRNYGFELSKGDFINWFDSDDLYLPNAFQNFVANFDLNTDVVVSKLEIIDFETGNKINENVIFSQNCIQDYYLRNIVFYVCGPVWKRSFLMKKKELFDERISNLDDWDFNLRMLYQNPEIKYINNPLIQYRTHENSLSNEIQKLNLEEIQSELYAREKHIDFIKANKLANIIVLQRNNLQRYKFFLRAMLVTNHQKKYYFFKKLLKKQFQILDFLGMMQSIFGFTIYTVFKKGYRFL
jgi:glycosyltransferase involved in cell wall biosynthesis